MNKITLASLATFVALAGGCTSAGQQTSTQTTSPVASQTPTRSAPVVPTLNYPVTKKGTQTDNYHGTTVADPYRWLEDPDSPETEAWVKAQNEVTFAYLSGIPYRDKIRARMEKLWNYPRYSAPSKEGGNYYLYKNNGLQNQAVLYVQNTLESEPEVFLDPNKLSYDGTTSLSTVRFSKDGRYMAYGTSAGGSDWNEYFVMETATKKLLSDKLDWVKVSGLAWAKDGFYYSRYDAPKSGNKLASKNEFHRVYYHKVGTSQSQDQLVFETKEHPLRFNMASTTEDERFLIITSSQGGNNNIFSVKDLSKLNSAFVPVVTKFTNQFGVIDNEGDKLLVRTNHGAPNYKVVLIDPKNPKPENWKTIIPESKNLLQGISTVGNRLIASYLKDASSQAIVFDRSGKQLHEVALPGIGTVSGFGGKKEDKETFYTFTSFTVPPSIYRYDIANNKSTLFRMSEADVKPDLYETKQVFYNSKDGTRVPMFIVHKKGLKLDGQNPTLLYAYGGFNVSMTPGFTSANMLWLENGGVYAMPNLRGGGEYGAKWHKGGSRENKQNTFDDFIAAAEYLKKEGYTSTEKLAMRGGSNGGLLIGAVMTQRPDLAKVAIPSVGVLDMLRFHKFTIGWNWVPDYGSADTAAHFSYLHKYSPLHNLREGVKYPSTLVTTADHDDRVVPAHSFKFISALQEKGAKVNPYLIRVDIKAGHGAGKSTKMQIDEWADIWSFCFYEMGVNLQNMPQ